LDGARHVRGSSTLQAIFLATLLGSAFADGFYKFSRAHILQSFPLPTITLPLLGALKENFWFGTVEVLQGLLGLAGAEWVRRRVRLEQAGAPARTLLALHAAITAAVLVFTFTGQFWLALAAWALAGGIQELAEPITQAWLNQDIPSRVRATVLSMSSQAGNLGALGSSTGLGTVGDRFGVRSALTLAGAILLPILLIYARGARERIPAGHNPSG
jgi:predicted MFS family arabinose efflux permease